MTVTELLELNQVSKFQVTYADWLAIRSNQRAHSAFGIFVIMPLMKFSKILPHFNLGGINRCYICPLNDG